MRPSIVVHGGAWAIPDALVDAHAEGCRHAAEIGYGLLVDGACGEDAVETAVRSMETDDTFDAGVGSFLNRDGYVELDAGFMEGRDLNVGGVAAVRDVLHPVTLARRIMESDHVLLVGPGASQFATHRGIPRCDPAELVVPREVAAGCTGDGEAVMRLVLAKHAVDALGYGQHPQAVAERCVQHLLRRVGGRAGIITLDPRGRCGCAFSTARMARAWIQEGAVVAAVDPDPGRAEPP